MYKVEYANFKKNEKMYKNAIDLKYINYNYEYKSQEFTFLLLWLILFLMVFLIVSIIAPLTFDNIIPINGLYWLISWIPMMVMATLYVIIYISNSIYNGYMPFFSEKQITGETQPSLPIFVASHFTWIFPFFLGIGLKLLIWRNDPVWFWVMLPTTIIIFLNIFNTLPTWIYIIKEYPLSYIIFLNVLLLSLSFSLGIFLSCFKLDGIWFDMNWSTVFIPFHIIPLIISLIPIEVIAFYPDICYIIGSSFISMLVIFLTNFWWLTFMLVGLKLDGNINTLFVVCFIPFYSMGGFICLGVLCVGVGMALCAC